MVTTHHLLHLTNKATSNIPRTKIAPIFHYCTQVTKNPLLYGSTGSANNSKNLIFRYQALSSSSSNKNNTGLTHLDPENPSLPRMVDVSEKITTVRVAHARATVSIPRSVLGLLGVYPRSNNFNFKEGITVVYDDTSEIKGAKGPVFSSAIIAGKVQ